MNNIMLYSLLTMVSLGILSAILLYIIAQKFNVIEDPRIDEVTELLSGANCGGCGYAGCRSLAEAIVKAGNMENKKCPPGGDVTIKQISDLLGFTAEKSTPQMAVVRCNGSFTNSPKKNNYNAAQSCYFANMLYAGEGGCPNGCLGYGDCVSSCMFDAIKMDVTTGLPDISEKCVACGICVKSCPRGIIELRNRGIKDRRIFISCVNTEKGATARKNCSVACIGCSKCVQACAFDAIEMKQNVAYIDFIKCRLCQKCISACPTGSICAVNFPTPKKEDVIEEVMVVNSALV